MQDQELIELIKAINAGKYSRNRHFEAFKKDPLRKAKTSQLRVRAIQACLDRHRQEPRKVALDSFEKDGHTHLRFHLPHLALTWVTALQSHELTLLLERSDNQALLNPVLSAC